MLTDCGESDIAFLLDGSGSVLPEDFVTVKTFVKNLMDSLNQKGTKARTKFKREKSTRRDKFHFPKFSRIVPSKSKCCLLKIEKNKNDFI